MLLIRRTGSHVRRLHTHGVNTHVCHTRTLLGDAAIVFVA